MPTSATDGRKAAATSANIMKYLAVVLDDAIAAVAVMKDDAPSTSNVICHFATSPPVMRDASNYAAEVMKNTTTAAGFLRDDITSAANA